MAVAKQPLAMLEKAIGYTFDDKELLYLALRHRSVGGRNNERLEFLGDSLLNCIVANRLFHDFPKLKEGDLSRLRAALVKGATLAELGREFSLSDYIELGGGELKSGGFRRESILADAVEGIIGAIFLDSSFPECEKTVLSWLKSRFEKLPRSGIPKDPKTQLQEHIQALQLPLPTYDVVETKGQAHQQTFFIECRVSNIPEVIKGEGSSRRRAEQQAAARALEVLGVKSGHTS